jgi:hypothetical protein
LPPNALDIGFNLLGKAWGKHHIERPSQLGVGNLGHRLARAPVLLRPD